MITKKNKKFADNQFFFNIVANVISYSSTLIISFILTPFLIKHLGKATYSFYPMANTIVSYLSVFMSATNSIASRFVTIELVKKNYTEANKYFSSTLMVSIVMVAILIIPMSLIIVFLDKIMSIPTESVNSVKALFILVFIAMIINLIANILGISTFAKNRIDLRSINDILTALLRLSILGIAYTFFKTSIIYIGLAAVITSLFSVMVQNLYTKKLLPELNFSKKMISKDHVMALFSSGSWNSIISFGNIMLAGFSVILANMLAGANAGGDLSIVQIVPQFVNGIILMLVGIFFPIITYKYAENNISGLIDELKKAQKYIGTIGSAAITTFVVIAPNFFTIWVPNQNATELTILSIITVLPLYLTASIWSLTNLYEVMNKVKIPALYTLLSGIINVIISALLYKFVWSSIYVFSIVSSTLQILWLGVFTPLYASRILNVKWNTFYKNTIINIGTSLIGYVLLIFLKKFVVINGWISLIFSSVLFGGIILLLMVVIYFFAIKLFNQYRRVNNEDKEN